MLKQFFMAMIVMLMMAALPGVGAADDAADTISEQESTQEIEQQETYTKNEVTSEIEEFFSGTSEGLADIVEKIFKEQGRPTGFIKGNEGGGALVVGLRYGEGTMKLKSGGTRKVYWQGPSVGFDFGGNASKVFTLIYNMHDPEQIFQRFPGVDGSVYVVGGFSMNYQRSGDVTLAPIRTGVGLRLGANVGYLHYTREKKINPF
jgi:hypothetical protein